MIGACGKLYLTPNIDLAFINTEGLNIGKTFGFQTDYTDFLLKLGYIERFHDIRI